MHKNFNLHMTLKQPLPYRAAFTNHYHTGLCLSRNYCLADELNHSMQNGVFPNKFRLAKLLTVFKSGAKHTASNY